MDKDTLESNINTLKEMILDEHKLITYVSISKELCIHVNDSKKLLTAVVEDIRKKQPDTDLNVSYIISGLSDGNNARTIVASEKEIDKLRSSFQIVFFQHIYSVSKGFSLVDNVVFLAVNKFEDLPLCTGLIKNSSCIKRTSDEIRNLKSNSQQSVETELKLTTPPAKKIKEDVKKNSQNGKDETKTVTKKVHESKSEPIIKTEIPSPKKDSLNIKQTDNRKNGNKTHQKGIAGFFNKSNSVLAKKVTKDTTESKQDIVIKIENEKQTINESVDVMEVDEEVLVKKEPKQVIKKEQKEMVKKTENDKEKLMEKLKNNSLNQIKKHAKVDKKRKRVLHVSDSESDEEKNDPFVDDEEPGTNLDSDDEIPPTPTVNAVKITSGIVNPKKRRKVVDKTYTDEDGYILTKKEEVYESCSENEDEASVKENIKAPQPNLKLEVSPKDKKTPKNSKKKISPPQKGKQATLMNFFKKV